MKTETLDALAKFLPDHLLLMEPRSILDEAVLAATFDEDLKPRAVYDQREVARLLAEFNNTSPADEREWLAFNTGDEVVWVDDLLLRPEED